MVAVVSIPAPAKCRHQSRLEDAADAMPPTSNSDLDQHLCLMRTKREHQVNGALQGQEERRAHCCRDPEPRSVPPPLNDDIDNECWLRQDVADVREIAPQIALTVPLPGIAGSRHCRLIFKENAHGLSNLNVCNCAGNRAAGGAGDRAGSRFWQ